MRASPIGVDQDLPRVDGNPDIAGCPVVGDTDGVLSAGHCCVRTALPGGSESDGMSLDEARSRLFRSVRTGWVAVRVGMA
jgi:hypothetical protein